MLIRDNFTKGLYKSFAKFHGKKYGSQNMTVIFKADGRAVVECLTREQGAAGSSHTSVTALCPLAIHINPSLVLVQPRMHVSI